MSKCKSSSSSSRSPACRFGSRLGRSGTPERQFQDLHEGKQSGVAMRVAFTANPRDWVVRVFETVAQRERAGLLTARREKAEVKRKS